MHVCDVSVRVWVYTYTRVCTPTSTHRSMCFQGLLRRGLVCLRFSRQGRISLLIVPHPCGTGDEEMTRGHGAHWAATRRRVQPRHRLSPAGSDHLVSFCSQEGDVIL